MRASHAALEMSCCPNAEFLAIDSTSAAALDKSLVNTNQTADDNGSIRVLLWNTNKKSPDIAICQIAAQVSADLVFLIEYSGCTTNLAASLSSATATGYVAAPSMNGKLCCLHNNSSLDLSEIYYHKRFSVRRLRIGNALALICLVHGVDAMHNSLEARTERAREMMSDLRRLHRDQSAVGIIILGDLNLNPYDSPMNQASVFNAMMTKGCASRRGRTVQGHYYDFFYNPMWSLLGDRNPGPPGTLYYTGNQGFYGWNMYDQVLLHYALVDHLAEIKILDSIGSVNVANSRGQPDRSYSDHFPLFFALQSLP